MNFVIAKVLHPKKSQLKHCLEIASFFAMTEYLKSLQELHSFKLTKEQKKYTMNIKEKTFITVEASIHAPMEKVWKFWTLPEHITKWNNASDEWHTPRAENDLQMGGKFLSRMEAKDGSFGFDFYGVYDEVKINELIAYTLGDGRKVKIDFTSSGAETKVKELFEAETENTIELQKGGWQAILNNFKKYAETN